MFNVNQFKQRLKAEREEKKLKQEEFAKLIGIARASASYYENQNNSSLPNAEILYNMADTLKVSTDFLLGNIKEKSKDLDIHDICEKTGLTEKTVTYLLGPSRKYITSLVDAIVENEATDNSFLDLIADIIGMSEHLISVGYPKLTPVILIQHLTGTREFPELEKAEHDYIDKYMSLELNIFKLQLHISDLIKKMSKFDDVQIMKRRKY